MAHPTHDATHFAEVLLKISPGTLGVDDLLCHLSRSSGSKASSWVAG